VAGGWWTDVALFLPFAHLELGVTKISGNQRFDDGSFLSSPLLYRHSIARLEAHGLPPPAARLLAFLPSLI